MRKSVLGVGAAALLLAGPARAVGVEDLAKIVLGSGSILKKAEASCQASGKLSKSDTLALTFARAAAEQALPISQFQSLDRAADAEATSASQATGFCPETKKKKSGLMSKIRKAGKALIQARMLG